MYTLPLQPEWSIINKKREHTCSSGSTCSMDICTNIDRSVIVDYNVHILDINTTREVIRTDQDQRWILGEHLKCLEGIDIDEEEYLTS